MWGILGSFKREQGTGNRELGVGKRQEARGKRQEARGKRQEARGKRSEGKNPVYLIAMRKAINAAFAFAQRRPLAKA